MAESIDVRISRSIHSVQGSIVLLVDYHIESLSTNRIEDLLLLSRFS